MSEEILKKVKEIVAEVLKIDADSIAPENHFSLDLGADSVQSIELVAAFCEGFEIEMDEDKALEVATVKDAVAYIAKICEEQG